MTKEMQRPNLLSRPLSTEEQHYYNLIINRLIDVRKLKNLSQAMLDDKIGVSEGMVAKWESKARLPGAFFLMCWCISLDLQLTLLDRK